MRFLLLQVRNDDDPMLRQEIGCFARALHCPIDAIAIHSLLAGVPTLEQIRSCCAVLIGGSGDYSVAQGGPWLEPSLETMRHLCAIAKPTFASCWGFQAMARALGGEVITDLSRAELGTVPVQLTEEGQNDELFAPLGETFVAPMGHQDCVTRLPSGVIRLASTALVHNQAFRIDGTLIYGSQFHPELDRQSLIERLETYPQYVESISGESVHDFADQCVETPATNRLLSRFSQMVQSMSPSA